MIGRRTEDHLRRFFRNAEEKAREESQYAQSTRGRRAEVTLEREIVSVFHAPGMVAEPGQQHCPCCGQALPAPATSCPAHPGQLPADVAAAQQALKRIEAPQQTKLSDEVK
jgi:hypothetical protein